jgi:hypothetical protein
MVNIHDGQQPEPSAGGIAGDWEMLGGSSSVPSSFDEGEPTRLYAVARYER